MPLLVAGKLPSGFDGESNHKASSLLPLPIDDVKLLHIFFVGSPQEHTHQRRNLVPNLKMDIVLKLQQLLHE